MQSETQKIQIIINQTTGSKELVGINGEREVTPDMITAIRRQPELLGYIALRLAHNRTEEQCNSETHSVLGLGNRIGNHIIAAEVELREHVASSTNCTAKLSLDKI